MASCDLTIELGKGDPVYRPGEKITGSVIVRTSAPVKCDALDVSVDWYTHGRGNRTRGSITKKTLFSGELSAGREYRYPFELDAPATPRAYHGELLNVDLAVKATADIPWAFDPTTETEIVVLHEGDAHYAVDPQAKEKGSTSGCFPVAAGATLVGAIVAPIAIAVDVAACGQVGLVLFAGGLIGGAVTIRKWLAERKTGAVTVSLWQGKRGGYREVTDLGQLRMEVHLAQHGATVNAVTAELKIRERVSKGSGTNKSTYYHNIFGESAQLEASGGQHFLGALRLPPRGEAPFPFEAPDNHVDWFVEVEVDIEGWPDWKGVFDLTVAPGTGEVR